MSHTLLILKNHTTFKDVQMMLIKFFDVSTGFRFSKISVECSVHSCSCPWTYTSIMKKSTDQFFFQALRRASAEFTEIKRLFTYFYFNNWIKKEQQSWCLELISSPFFELKAIIQGHADKVHIWETLIHIALHCLSIRFTF